MVAVVFEGAVRLPSDQPVAPLEVNRVAVTDWRIDGNFKMKKRDYCIDDLLAAVPLAVERDGKAGPALLL